MVKRKVDGNYTRDSIMFYKGRTEWPNNGNEEMEHTNAPCGMWGMTSNVVSCWESSGLMGDLGSKYQEAECSVRRRDKCSQQQWPQ